MRSLEDIGNDLVDLLINNMPGLRAAPEVLALTNYGDLVTYVATLSRVPAAAVVFGPIDFDGGPFETQEIGMRPGILLIDAFKATKRRELNSALQLVGDCLALFRPDKNDSTVPLVINGLAYHITGIQPKAVKKGASAWLVQLETTQEFSQ
ncbi:MAG: hypothetical protein RRC34_02890 [Lentisphaeria bacterium]|nr:hypothetical protein [Lentisphaeria bacterium]